MVLPKACCRLSSSRLRDILMNDQKQQQRKTYFCFLCFVCSVVETEDSPMQVEPIDNPKVTNVTLKQLDPHSRYRFQVRGRTSAGEGKPATREGATTLDGGRGTDLNPSPGGETHTSSTVSMFMFQYFIFTEYGRTKALFFSIKSFEKKSALV